MIVAEVDEEPEEDFEDEPLEERDFMPIRPRRDGKTGCLGGLMYFVFVISLSVILACVGWMAASDVLALNKEYTEGTVTLPESIFTEKEIEVENEDGSVTQKTVMSADLDYVANALKDAGLKAGDIDALTGATITSRGVCEAVTSAIAAAASMG